jgi:hypothetical protein
MSIGVQCRIAELDKILVIRASSADTTRWSGVGRRSHDPEHGERMPNENAQVLVGDGG